MDGLTRVSPAIVHRKDNTTRSREVRSSVAVRSDGFAAGPTRAPHGRQVLSTVRLLVPAQLCPSAITPHRTTVIIPPIRVVGGTATSYFAGLHGHLGPARHHGH